jgi:hypothetical protein
MNRRHISRRKRSYASSFAHSFGELEDRRMLASIVESGGLVTVYGTQQSDTIKILGNQSNSTFTVSINHDSNLTETFANNSVDKVLVWAWGGNDTVSNTAHVATEINGQDGNDILWGGYVNDVIRGGDGNDKLYGRSGDDTLSGNNGVDRLHGHDGNDKLYGGEDTDYLYGHDGNDVLAGHQARDYIYGHVGDDRIYAGDGDDFAWGSVGADAIYGGNGVDVLRGESGNDLIRGQNGDDRLYGSTGNDRLFGDAGTDKLYGEGGNDTLRGGSGNDKLYGGSNNDKLFGESGIDDLFGGGHDDILSGGTDDEIDRLWGNGGTDEFYAVSVDDVRDNSSSESVTDPVAGSASLGNSAAGNALTPAQSSTFLNTLPDDGSVDMEVDGATTIVTTNSRRMVYQESGNGALEQKLSVPVTYDADDIDNVMTVTAGLSGNPALSSLGDATFSVVPVATLEGALGSGGGGFTDAIVASGSGSAIVVGGIAESAVAGGGISRAITPFATSSFVSSSAATVVSNVAGVLLGRAAGGAAASATQSLLGQFQAPFTGQLASQFVSTAANLALYSVLNPTTSSLPQIKQPKAAFQDPRVVVNGVANRPITATFRSGTLAAPVPAQATYAYTMRFNVNGANRDVHYYQNANKLKTFAVLRFESTDIAHSVNLGGNVTQFPAGVTWATATAQQKGTASSGDIGKANTLFKNSAASAGWVFPVGSQNPTLGGVKYTWHHDTQLGVLQLVPKDLHDAAKGAGLPNHIGHASWHQPF